MGSRLEDLKELKVVVTGGAGFIGSHLVEKLAPLCREVVVYDNFDEYYTGKEDNLKRALQMENVKLVRGDILDFNLLRGVLKEAHVVFHLAAQPGVRFSLENPFKTVKVNVDGTLNVLKASLQANVKRVVFASSSSVYGNPTYVPVDEDHPKRPISIYGASKLAAEELCSTFYRLFNLDVVALRYHTVYGPRQRPDMAFHKWIKAALTGKPIVIYGDGSQERDFTYIDDAVEATIASAVAEGVEGMVFNVARGSPIKVMDAVKAIVEEVGVDVEVVHEEPKPGDVKATYGDISRASKILGYRPKVSLREGIREMVSWLKERLKKGRGLA